MSDDRCPWCGSPSNGCEFYDCGVRVKLRDCKGARTFACLERAEERRATFIASAGPVGILKESPADLDWLPAWPVVAVLLAAFSSGVVVGATAVYWWFLYLVGR